VGAVGEWSLQEKPSHKKKKKLRIALGRRKGGTLVCYSGRIALRRKKRDAYDNS
jgi:hypothetical protein